MIDQCGASVRSTARTPRRRASWISRAIIRCPAFDSQDPTALRPTPPIERGEATAAAVLAW